MADEVLEEVLDEEEVDEEEVDEEEVNEEEELDLNEEGSPNNDPQVINQLELDENEFSDEYNLELGEELKKLNINEEGEDPLKKMENLKEKVLNLDDLENESSDDI